MSDEESVAGMPDPDGEYFARISFGRTKREDEAEDKLYMDFKYPNLPYGAMVSIQKLLGEGALQDLIAMGEMTSAMMGQEVIGIEEVRAYLVAKKAEQGKPGQKPKV